MGMNVGNVYERLVETVKRALEPPAPRWDGRGQEMPHLRVLARDKSGKPTLYGGSYRISGDLPDD